MPDRNPSGRRNGTGRSRQPRSTTAGTTPRTTEVEETPEIYEVVGNRAMVELLTGNPELQRGDRDGEVPLLQEHLDALGLNIGTPDGIFGGDTEAAVMRYQAARSLTQDGIFDEHAALALTEDIENNVTIERLEASVSASLQEQLSTLSAEGADVDTIAAITMMVLEVVPDSLHDVASKNLPLILQQCAAAGVTNPDQVAYILATAEHESDFGDVKYSRSQSLVEDRNGFTQQADGTWSARVHTNGKTVTANSSAALETAYWDSAYGGKLDNESGTTDAKDYRGRGFVQITGQANYEKVSELLNRQGFSYTHNGVTYGGEGNAPIDLLAHPEHVNEVPSVAARILVEGSLKGSFTNKALGDYVNDEQTDYKNARSVINNDVSENGEKIAELARNYAVALRQDSAWQKLFRNS